MRARVRLLRRNTSLPQETSDGADRMRNGSLYVEVDSMTSALPRKMSTLEKAFEINLDTGRYGTFAEIGAGQEVVRWFFQAGGAAGTISKSISAYDMQVSDAIYGPSKRYVSRDRLEAMLAHEQHLTRTRLSVGRGDDSCFFSFADTVTARNYLGTNDCHAWMGIRFQDKPHADDSTIIVHVRLLDDTNAAQQEALGVLGVNLIHSAYTLYETPTQLVAALLDGLSVERIEIDMINFSGPVFAGVDNRVMSLRLVELGLTGVAMFAANGEVLQPSEALRKKTLLVQRGRFRPITHINMDILRSALETLARQCEIDEEDILPIFEISMHNLMEESYVCLDDFISRADIISTTGCAVMISDFREYHRLAQYLYRYTDKTIGLPMGLETLRTLFEERYYDNLDGGILEGLGRLFKAHLNLLAYPLKNADTGQIESLDDVRLKGSLPHLFEYLRDRGFIRTIENPSHKYLDIRSHNVLSMIAAGDERWTELVPAGVASAIVERRLFGYGDSVDVTASVAVAV